MRTNEYLETVASSMSQSDFGCYIGLVDELCAHRNAIFELEGRLKELAKVYGIPGLDGIRSSAIQALKEELRATGHNIDSWWVKAAAHWVCPCCRRTKGACSRLDTSQRLLGKLTAHHDHIREFIENALYEYARANGMAGATLDEASTRFLHRFEDGFSRFDEILICEDCNNADAAAKKLVGASPHFTFTPDEIGSFILSKPHAAHAIDASRARHAYESAKKLYEDRIEAINRLARRTLAGEHWYEFHDFRARPDAIRGAAETALATFGFDGPRWILVEELLLEKQSPRGELDAWRRRRREAPDSPTKNEIAFVIENHKTLWNNLPQDWRCPGCSRTKIETIRRNKQARWMFALDEMNFVDNGQRYGTAKVLVCDACIRTARDFNMEARRHPNIRSGGPFLTLVELRKILQPRPHGLHNVDDSAAQALMRVVTDPDSLAASNGE